MGYTTQFSGQFDLDQLPTAEAIVRLNEIADDPDTAENNPGSYCQWVLTKDCRHLEWDCNEKFYNYVEWLQYLIDNVFKPIGVNVTGSVSYQGESVGDTGVVIVEDGIARAVKGTVLGEELTELLAFRAFILSRRDSDEILGEWQSFKAKHL